MRYQGAIGAGSRRAEDAKSLIVRRRGRRSSLLLRDDDDKEEDDDDDEDETPSPTTTSPTSTNSPPSSPTTTSSSSSTSSSSLTSTTSTTSTTLTSTATPPPPPPPPPPPSPPPPQTFGTTPPEQTTSAPVATSFPQAAPAVTSVPEVTPTPQAITQTPTTLSSLTLPSSSASVPVATLKPDQAQTQNAGTQNQSGPQQNSAAIAAAILGKGLTSYRLMVVKTEAIALVLKIDADKGPLAILGVAALLGFFGWRYINRRRKRQQEDADVAEDGFYDGDADVTDEKSSRISGNQSSRDAMPSWLKRQVSKLTQGEQRPEAPQRPKEAKVNGWMDQHASRMLDPMYARASMVSSVASDLGPPPSISPASVVGGNRQSVLSEMGQIRRDAVPPPLDIGMVERAKKMHEEQQQSERAREIARAAALLEAPASVAGSSSSSYLYA